MAKGEARVMGEAKNNISKGYRHRSFVLDCGVLDRLQAMADEKERSLNWLVARVLKEYCDGEVKDDSRK